VNVLLVDDHALVRRGIGLLVKERFVDAVIRDAGTADEAVAVLTDQPVDVALVDVRMPGRDGFELLRHMKSSWPNVAVIMLSSFDQPEYVKRALVEGAAGYLLKDANPEDLEQAIRMALSGGGNVLSARAVRSLFHGESATGDETDALVRPHGLTRRETGILALLAEGRSNRAIARTLFLSEKTVKAHLAAVFRKLGVANRTQAAMAAVSMGIGPAPGAATGTDSL